MEYFTLENIAIAITVLLAIFVALIRWVMHLNKHVLHPDENEKNFRIVTNDSNLGGGFGYHKDRGPYPLVYVGSGNHTGPCIVVGMMQDMKTGRLIRTLRFSPTGYRCR